MPVDAWLGLGIGSMPVDACVPMAPEIRLPGPDPNPNPNPPNPNPHPPNPPNPSPNPHQVAGAPKDAPARKAFFSGASGVAYRVAGCRLTLDDIEHGEGRCMETWGRCGGDIRRRPSRLPPPTLCPGMVR